MEIFFKTNLNMLFLFFNLIFKMFYYLKAPVQVGGPQHVPLRRTRRWRHHRRRPDGRLGLGNLQAVEGRREHVQPQGDRR